MRIGGRAAAVLLLTTAPVWAQAPSEVPEPAPAGTADGAKAVVDGMAPYFGRAAFDRGIIRIEPDPAGYRLTVDLGPMLQAMKSPGTEFSLSPYSAVISRRDDGNWNYFTDSKIDAVVKATVNGEAQDITYDVGPMRFKGVFSPAVASLLSGRGSVERFSMRSAQGGTDVVAEMGRTSFDLTGTPTADGSLDFAMKQTGEEFTESVAVKEQPGMPPGGIRFDIKAAGFDATSDFGALRSRPMADLYSFFVAHPEYFAGGDNGAVAAKLPKLADSQDELKAKIRAAMPLWSKVGSSYTLTGIEMTSQYGGAKVDRFTTSLTSDGISRSGSVHYATAFDGLDIATAAMPPWAKPLVPKAMDLRMRLDNLDLQTPADIALADLDVSRAEPVSQAAGERIAASFTENPPRFVLEPSTIAAEDVQLAMSGSFAFSAGKPAATVDITAAGLDKAIATLQTAAQTQPEINQAIGGLSMAKGFGKPLPDGRIQWVVDASSDGSVKINGFQIKGPDPVAADPGLGDDGSDPSDDGDAVPDDATPLPDQAPTDDNAIPVVPPQP